MASTRPVSVALISAPWFSIQTPPIPIATLAAHLRARTRARVECHHPYLRVAEEVGYDFYRAMQATLLCGMIGSVLHFRMDRGAAAGVIRARCRAPGTQIHRLLRRRIRSEDDALSLLERVEAVLTRWVEGIDWSRYTLIGFSNSHSQLFFSLYLAGLIRRAHRGAVVVFGGSECNPAVAPSIAKCFPEVDAVISGEGEGPLQRLVEALDGSPESWRSHVGGIPFHMPGTLSTSGNGRGHHPTQIDDLDELPLPSYDEYFAELDARSIADETKNYLLPFVEVGRGCYWSRPVPGVPERAGCAFCGEKGLWAGYRHKSAERVVAEVAYLASRHELTNVFLGDSGIHPHLAEDIFRGIRKLGTHTSYSLNVRPRVPPDLFALFEECGVTHLTIGFEALSTGVLNVMNKGTRAIDVLYVLKKCEQHGIDHGGRLICHHPGVLPKDLEDVLVNLDFSKWYAPFGSNTFMLLAGSPIHAHPEKFGLSDVCNHAFHRGLVPDWVFEELDLYRKGYTDRNRDATYPLWIRIEERLKQWAREYRAVHSFLDVPMLSLHDGGSFLELISRELVDGAIEEKTVRLRGRAAALYRACDTPKQRVVLAEKIEAEPDDVSALLDPLVERRFVFREENRYLALGVPVKGRHASRYAPII